MNSDRIKQMSYKHGFLACGIAKAGNLDFESHQLKNWLDMGYHGEMAYLEKHFEKRTNPTKLVEGAKSILCLAFNYFPEPRNKTDFKIARYAYGDDYHTVIKEKLFALMADIQNVIPNFAGRAFVDSAPVMERQWAERAGLGWIGKNSLIIRKGVGSYFFLAEIISNLELQADTPETDHCGTCTACIDACPTQAIVQSQVIDSRLCISYQTIEKKEPSTLSVEDSQRWIYGCDICQEVCPWNRFAEANKEPKFAPRDIVDWSSEEWRIASKDLSLIQKQIKRSAMERAGVKKIASQSNAQLDSTLPQQG